MNDHHSSSSRENTRLLLVCSYFKTKTVDMPHVRVLEVCSHASTYGHTHPHAHVCTHTHTPRWNAPSFVQHRGDLYRAEMQAGWHFGALELGGVFERKYDKLCLWNVLARMCKDFEPSPRWTLVCRSSCIPVHLTTCGWYLFIFFFKTLESVPYRRLSSPGHRAGNKWASVWEQGNDTTR